jgi:hypothetical protein
MISSSWKPCKLFIFLNYILRIIRIRCFKDIKIRWIFFFRLIYYYFVYLKEKNLHQKKKKIYFKGKAFKSFSELNSISEDSLLESEIEIQMKT